MKNTAIEWCDHTFNPWEGCTKVSPGCAHCYAEARNQRFSGGANWGPGAPRRRTAEANWKQPLAWNKDTEWFRKVDVYWHRPRVFCASLADWLDDEVPVEWLADLLELIRCTPHLDWLLLTKRPQNWRSRIDAARIHAAAQKRHDLADWCASWLAGHAPANVWIGTTVEDQPRADERREALRAIPARVHFVSYEPALARVDWSGWEWIDWLISGGESGRHARPTEPDFHRGARDFCRANHRAYFFKQWGEWLPALQDCPGHLNASDTPERIGKFRAGRRLDGVEHSDFPETEVAATAR